MPQERSDSGFGPASTTADVIKGIDLTGKVAIVTGGYVSLGLETTKTLVKAGATVIVGYRTEEKAKKNLEGLNVETVYLDLLDPASIEAFAKRFLDSGRPLHLLINNAAIMAAPLMRDSRGYEAQFSTNVLGHYALTVQLWPALVKAGGARIVNVSSRGHHRSSVVFDDWSFERREYNPWSSYGQSKTGNIMLSVALDARGKGVGIRSFSLHPGGIVTTELGRFEPREARVARLKEMGMLDEAGNPILDPLKGRKSIPQGAATQVWAATSPFLAGKGGLYLENCNIAESVKAEPGELLIGSDGYGGVKEYAIDPDSAEKLWQLCERLTGVKL